MKKLPIKALMITAVLIIIVLSGLYLKGYVNKKSTQSDIFNEETESISQKEKHQDSNKIYQDNKVVGLITGEVTLDPVGDTFFEEISETTNLKRNLPLEYQGVKYQIIRMENYIKEYVNTKSEKKYDVLRGVTCREYKEK